MRNSNVDKYMTAANSANRQYFRVEVFVLRTRRNYCIFGYLDFLNASWLVFLCFGLLVLQNKQCFEELTSLMAEAMTAVKYSRKSYQVCVMCGYFNFQ